MLACVSLLHLAELERLTVTSYMWTDILHVDLTPMLHCGTLN